MPETDARGSTRKLMVAIGSMGALFVVAGLLFVVFAPFITRIDRTSELGEPVSANELADVFALDAGSGAARFVDSKIRVGGKVVAIRGAGSGGALVLETKAGRLPVVLEVPAVQASQFKVGDLADLPCAGARVVEGVVRVGCQLPPP